MAVSTCAQDVINGACAWAEAIANDNRFHYGYGKPAHHNGCYFCGTNTLKGGRAKTGVKNYEFSYCCNPFVHAAFSHGGGEPTMLKICQRGSSYDFHKGKGYDSSSLFRNLGHPAKSTLQKGDVLCKDNHVALYIGNGMLAEAAGGDDNNPGSAKWNKSIHVATLSDSRYNGFKRVHRYIGNGGGEMQLPDGAAGIEDDGAGIEDDGAGIDMRQAISRLYSSDNFEYVTTEESEFKTKVARFREDLQAALAKINFSTISPSSGAIAEHTATKVVEAVEFEKDKPKKILSGRATDLLSYPTWVEAPTIVLDFNGVKIGGYGNNGDIYPNYITSMSVNKVNGRINQYNINLSYQIRPGEDPNFIDKLIARTGYTQPLKILYGDSNYPNAYYREESAVIMDAKHNDNVSSYRIDYNITAVSSIAVAQTSMSTFNEKIDKPSTVIYDLLYNSGDISKSLINIFPGMRNKLDVFSKGLIPTNDNVVQIGGMSNVSPLTYLSYLVACMSNNVNNSTYYLNIVDNSNSEFSGSYFKIDEVISYNNTPGRYNIASNYFELDIGYPSNNYITNFQICNNNYWSLVYNFTGDIPKFEYGIDDNGDLIQHKTNALHIINKYDESSIISANWWKQVTEFPITAKVTLKGLISPAILMSYIKINALFYGQRDLASGLYVVTKQEDSVSGSGYNTTLTLLRVAEDNG